MNIDYEIWNAMSMEEKKIYIESLPTESLIDHHFEKTSEWSKAMNCAVPIAMGVFAILTTLILFSP